MYKNSFKENLYVVSSDIGSLNMKFNDLYANLNGELNTFITEANFEGFFYSMYLFVVLK